jgi:hypothetical protein
MRIGKLWRTDDTCAAQNGGRFNFAFEGYTALPLEQAFWDELLGQAQAQWGIAMYEQVGQTRVMSTHLGDADRNLCT